MSYSIYCYFNDEDIHATSIYAQSGLYTHTGFYNDDFINVSGFSEPATFTATPNNGCVFTRWVYRLGSTSADQQYSYDNPFTYEGTETIYIRAEGEKKTGGDSGGDSSETSDFLTVEYSSDSPLIKISINFDIGFPDGYTIYIDNSSENISHQIEDWSYRKSFVEYEYTAPKSGTYTIRAVVWDTKHAGSSSYKYDADWGGYPSDKIKITIEATRPAKFEWKDSSIAQGKEICVVASDWNRLTENINEVRNYKGYNNYSFTFVKGVSNGYTEAESTKISADIYNEAVEAILGIGGKGINYVEANDYSNYKIKASHFTSLSNAINNIE